MRIHSLALLTVMVAQAGAEIRVPASTAYLDPDANSAKVSKSGITNWSNPQITVSWFGEIKKPGKLTAALSLTLPKGTKTVFKLSVEAKSKQTEAVGTGETTTVDFGEFNVSKAGYARFTLSSTEPSGSIEALLLDGPAVEDAHFNLDPRRNAASVHLNYPVAKDTEVATFYNEMTGVDDPVHTYYMACGFSRGYFGMQVNSPTERRIIFSVWDSGTGQTADRRSEVAEEDHVKLLAKGDDVHASDFGGEGTGGHSHLKYSWKTGETQRFAVTAKPEGTHTDYTGYWFHPCLLYTSPSPRD